MSDSYGEFIAAKAKSSAFPGIDHGDLATHLFPHQRDLVSWALRKGRAAIFAQTGLGKTAMEIEWSRHVAMRGRVLIFAPLAVAAQTMREAERFGVSIALTKRDDGSQIIVTNYDNAQHFDPGRFAGVVLDESSILKSFNGKTRNALIEGFKDTPFRLCATATPAPNDFTELGNHSEFLGIKTRVEMLAEYFVHDMDTTQDWRLKGHAEESFWRWLATWGAVVRTPADLGHDDAAYRLPPLNMHEVVLSVEHSDAWATGNLFAVNAVTLDEQRKVRRATMGKRCDAAAKIADDGRPLIIWCELNDEADELKARIPDAIEVRGSDDTDEKTDKLDMFARGRARVLISKVKICGFGMNWQHCSQMVFMGASHSYEGTYQAIRRCWRFGQTKPVDVHIIRAETEQVVVDNYRRKEADAERMGAEMSSHVLDSLRAEIQGANVREWNAYDAHQKMQIPSWLKTEVPA